MADNIYCILYAIHLSDATHFHFTFTTEIFPIYKSMAICRIFIYLVFGSNSGMVPYGHGCL